MRGTSITGTSKKKNTDPNWLGLSLTFAIVLTHGVVPVATCLPAGTVGLKAQTNEGESMPAGHAGLEFIIDLTIK
jgi:hypothetical protein